MSQKDASIETTCPYCGVGCGVTTSLDDDRLIAVSGTRSHPANFGKLCVKGSNLPVSLCEDDRLLHPLVDGIPQNWETALSTAAERLKGIIEQHGPEAVAVYASGQLLTEDYYVANKFVKGALGHAQIDTNSRLCMASAVSSYKRSLGADAVPTCYDDLEEAGLILMVGSNAAWAHPILYNRMMQARRRLGTRIVVIDPRETASCAIADLHLPLRPGSDAALFNFLLRSVANSGALDENFITRHTEGFEKALLACRDWDLKRTAEATDLSLEALSKLADWVVSEPRLITFYSQGVNQSSSGTDKGNAIINLHLATGRIGKIGAGPFSITGQPNAMGGREVGGLANQLASHMALENPGDRDKLARFWQMPSVADKPGPKAVELFQAVKAGSIKAIWVMATNPVVSLPDADEVKAALSQAELVIVSDAQKCSDTLAFAHIAFPAAAWGEKSGTVTNSERRISRQRSWSPLSGDAKPDWWIVTQMARKLGWQQWFPYESAADIFREHASLSGFENNGSRAFDISGLAQITDAEYDALPPVQWPVNAAQPQGTDRLYQNAHFYTPNGKARFIPISPRSPVAQVSAEFPILLNTGRLRDQWHTMTRTGQNARLNAHEPEPFVTLHPGDAGALGLSENELVHLENSRGQCTLRLKLSKTQRRGEAFSPIHWSGRFASAARVGVLFAPETDPLSGQPELKQAAIRIRALSDNQCARLITSETLDISSSVLYWARLAIEGAQGYSLALEQGVSWKNWLETLLDIPGLACLKGLRNGHAEYHFFDQGTLVAWLDTSPSDKVLDIRAMEQRWMEARMSAFGRLGEKTDESQVVCACFHVSKQDIEKAISEGSDSTFALGRRLRCGTQCGSCVPELEMLLREARDSAKSAGPAPTQGMARQIASIEGKYSVEKISS